MFGVTQHFVDVSSHDIASGFSKMIWHTETICQNPHGVGKLMLSKTVRDAGIKVVLTGEGSDEMLGGYDQMQRDFVLDPSIPERAKPSRPDFYRQQMLLPKHNQVSACLDDLRSPTFESAIGFFPSFYAKHVGKAKIFHSLVNADFLKTFGHRDEYAILLAQLDVKGQLTGRDRLHQSMYLWTKTSLQNYILVVLADRVEMGNSVESRVPFLDHRFVEFVATLPSTILNRQGIEKYILREATKPYISKTIYNRHKWAFLAPPAMPGGAYFDFIQDSLRGSQIPFLNQVSLRNLLDQLPKMSDSERGEYSILLTELLSMHYLQENFMSRATHAKSRSAEERSFSASTPG
jgi:asparagine synthase (glutamine-hydrolysing)